MTIKSYVTCTHCGGTGTIELTGVYSETLKLVIHYPNKNGRELAQLAGCKPTAMNNRLTALQRHGVATGAKFGREIRWTHKTTKMLRHRNINR